MTIKINPEISLLKYQLVTGFNPVSKAEANGDRTFVLEKEKFISWLEALPKSKLFESTINELRLEVGA